jgi:uncharacterized membrane protein
MKGRWLVLSTLLFLFLAVGARGAIAQGEQETLVGEVVALEPEAEGLRIHVALPVQSGGYEVVSVEPGGASLMAQKTKYAPGDRVLVARIAHVSGGFRYTIVDFYRTPSLFLLGLAFAIVVVAVGGFRGVRSILGLAITFAVMLLVLIPGILAGGDPVVVSLAACALVVFATLYLVHGFSWKTTAAVCGTLVALAITGGLAVLAMEMTKLTGLGTEESAFLQLVTGGSVDIRGLLLGGMILGALGVIDDVTVGQASTVLELHRANPRLSTYELFWRSMNVGRDHIASTVNTLVLAYAGAAMPLLLLFTMGGNRWDTVVSQEIVAVELVRTLVGSIGIVAAVPMTSLMAALVILRKRGGKALV